MTGCGSTRSHTTADAKTFKPPAVVFPLRWGKETSKPRVVSSMRVRGLFLAFQTISPLNCFLRTTKLFFGAEKCVHGMRQRFRHAAKWFGGV
jgi:hypothetical protein